jgi:hypothetical protein
MSSARTDIVSGLREDRNANQRHLSRRHRMNFNTVAPLIIDTPANDKTNPMLFRLGLA